jgi:hypothetical protein
MLILPRAAIAIEFMRSIAVRLPAVDRVPAGADADESPFVACVDLAPDEHVPGREAEGTGLAAGDGAGGPGWGVGVGVCYEGAEWVGG